VRTRVWADGDDLDLPRVELRLELRQVPHLLNATQEAGTSRTALWYREWYVKPLTVVCTGSKSLEKKTSSPHAPSISPCSEIVPTWESAVKSGACNTNQTHNPV
jgi:hypothetical protein